MKILCVPDSFKESMTAGQAARAMAQGVARVFPQATCVEIPVADGGEGFTAAMAQALQMPLREVSVTDPLGRPTTASFASDGHRAVLEIAEAAGISKVTPAVRRPRHMHTAGVGELIKAALDTGARELIIGLGGSVTTDGGAGMLAALGMKFYTAPEQTIAPEQATANAAELPAALPATPESLARLVRVDGTGLDPRLAQTQITVACDVDNPLTGPRGAAAIYGPQKGATPADVAFLDAALANFAQVSEQEQAANEPGSGAAGGLGFAFRAFLGAQLRSGIEVVIDAVQLRRHVREADVILTGEGSIDAQTLMGKTLAGIARLAQQLAQEQDRYLPVLAFAGKISSDLQGGNPLFAALVPIVAEVCTLEEALANGPANLAAAVERTMRAIQLGQKLKQSGPRRNSHQHLRGPGASPEAMPEG
ncbi:glycerate kinase GlxK [Actinobaculum suis]|uniref:Glycerate kinase GlxK n=1 Tax=Actinobaculum suis TaxID=1657 RepID=A0A7Z8Y7T5_9ACTO|nr:glycerate kinase [Actinobaculum suis]VDG75469.1 glycerate kinase GlxK [Actinobaculum suis]